MTTATIATVLGSLLSLAGGPSPPSVIALSDAPSCSFFVIHTPVGFTLAWWRKGFYLFVSGDVIHAGEVLRTGIHEIEIIPDPTLGEMGGQFEIEIVETGAPLQRAQDFFYRHCPEG